MSSSDPVVLVERRAGGVSVITINRPAARNALTTEIWDELAQAMNDAARDESRAVVLTGAGGYFSAGGDMKSSPSGGSGAFSPIYRLKLAHRVMQQVATMPIPVIAAVERGAVGLGWGLALACDMIIASRDASFAAPFTARGVVPDGGVGQILVRQLGRQRAADLLLMGATLTAEDAHRYGLAARLAAPGEAVADALACAEGLPADVPNAIELTKRLLRSAEDICGAAYLEQELALAGLCQLGPESALARERFQNRKS